MSEHDGGSGAVSNGVAAGTGLRVVAGVVIDLSTATIGAVVVGAESGGESDFEGGGVLQLDV